MNKYDKQSKELVDKGWRQMSLLLDETMPVKKGYGIKKYALLLLLLIFVGVGTYFVVDGYYSGQETELESTEEYVKINIQKETINAKNKSEIVEIEKNNTESITNGDIDKNQKLSKTRKITEQKEKKNNKDSQLKNYNSITNYDTPDLIAVNTREAIVKIESKEKNIKNKKNRFFKGIQNITPKQPILETDINLLYIDRIFMAFVKKPCADYLYETELNLVSENLKSIGGFEIGVNRNFALTDKFYIGGGLQYSFYKKYRTKTSFVKNYIQFDDFSKSNKKNGGSLESFNNNFRSPEVLSNFIDELHYLSIPVTVNYKTSKITYSIGLRASYMVYGKNYIADKQRLLDYNVVINSKNAFYDQNIFNKIDYSFTLGVNYFLSRQLSISAKANYSYIGIINSNNISQGHYEYAIARDIQFQDRFDKNIYFALGLKYKFGKGCSF